MAGFVVRQFRGRAPRLTPRLLADNQAQASSNTWFKRGSLTPLKANSAVLTLPKSPVQTIHRFGQSGTNEANYWFCFTGDVDVVRGPIAGDTQERTYYTDGTLPKVTDGSIALGANMPVASYTLGVPAPGTAPVAVVGGTPTSPTALAETRLYIVTLVTAWGEEGQPSDGSNFVDVQPGETVTLTLPAAPGGNFNFSAKRIYRSVPGSLGTPYLFVAEVPVATTEYVDSLTATDLGEELPSLDNEMPPAALKGLTAGPGGVMAGFDGKDVYFCEPFKPYAWPSKYSLTVDAAIVGIAVFDTSWLILTQSGPYLISGADPANYTMVKADLAQACVSKRSIVQIDGGVVFASPDGLFLIGGGVTRNLTEALFSRAEWQALAPSTLSGYVVDSQYVGFYGESAGFVLDLQTGDWTDLPWYASAGYYDPVLDALYLVTDSNSLVKFDSGSNATLTWRSKAFYLPQAVNMGAGRVEAASYPVTFKVYADGVLKHTQTVASGAPFYLPAGYLANTWEFEVSGSYEVFSAAVAQSMSEFQNG